jgi:hypothetical protein
MAEFAPPAKKPATTTQTLPQRAESPGSAVDTAANPLGPGQGLEPATRTRMEAAFGRDFAAVRIHSGAAAAAAASADGALAFTVANRIAFGHDQYRPETEVGKHLIAHELAHVVQQSLGGGAALSPEACEAEADRAGAQAARGDRVGTSLSATGVRVQRAVTDWTPPVRADEAGTTLDARTTEVPISGGVKGFDKFSDFVPAGAPVDVNNVHVFFAANAVVGPDANDVMIHGLRAASESSKWILICVPGFDLPAPGFQTIEMSEIADCLTAAGRQSTDVAALRLTAHSRGHNGLEQTLKQGKVKTSLIERVTVLDAFYQDTKKEIVGAGIDKSKVVQYDLVNALGTQSGQRSRIDGDQRILFSAVPPGTSHTLTDYMAAIGYVRLLQDLKVTKSDVAALIASHPLVDAQLTSLTLPPRGTFMSFGGAGVGSAMAVFNTLLPFATGGMPVDLVSWVILNHAKLDAILAIDNDASKGGLLAFLNNARYPNGMNVIGFTGSFSRYIAAHHFFVAEIAHELVE